MQTTFDKTLISPELWKGKILASENSLHHISPYIGKMKSSMARTLIEACSTEGQLVFDPFVGSGIVALESLLAGRGIISCDINPYAVALTKAKIFAPQSLSEALKLAKYYLGTSKSECKNINLEEVPEWVRLFFHPKTLTETLALARVLKLDNQDFLLGCLLGILHHQRPGFLSFPASHAVPYLRSRKFPASVFPELYEYRDVESRIIKKIERAYRNTQEIDQKLKRSCFISDASSLTLESESIDAVVTSPPYMNTLDYVRDNRLRLWLIDPQTKIEKTNPKNLSEFQSLMHDCLSRLRPALRPNGLCAIVTGEINSESSHCINTAETILQEADRVNEFTCEAVVEDQIPNVRRVRKRGAKVKREWIVVLRKRF